MRIQVMKGEKDKVVDSPYQYGYNSGKSLKKFYKKIIKLLSIYYQIKPFQKTYYKNQIHTLEITCPTLMEEINGLSDATHINIKQILHAQSALSNTSGECTITASTKNATKNNESFLTQNWDISALNPFFYLTRYFFTRNIQVHKTENTYSYVYLGLPALYEIPLVNEKNLSFCGNGTNISKNNHKHIDEGPGVPSYEIIRQTMMRCKNTKEVKNHWNKTQRSSYKHKNFPHHWDYANTTWCDIKGDLLSIEQTSKRIIFVDGNSQKITGGPKNIIWHANHHQWLDSYDIGSCVHPDYKSSGLRELRARKLLEENYGKITLDTCKKITRDHKHGFDIKRKNSGNICRHPDIYSLKATVFSFISEPIKMKIHITNSYPCRSEYKTIDCEKILFAE